MTIAQFVSMYGGQSIQHLLSSIMLGVVCLISFIRLGHLRLFLIF